MESIINFACMHAHAAPWIFFLLLMFAGLNIPISEDVILLAGGAIASTCTFEDAFNLFAWIFVGCWLSAWEAYGIGRYLGPKLYDMPWFRRFITLQKINRLHYYYEKFGIFTFIVGRFIPGGVRNALFMTAGLGKMPFSKFILRDGLACIISASLLFYIGYAFGENLQAIIFYVKAYHKMMVIAVAMIFLIVFFLLRYSRSQSTT